MPSGNWKRLATSWALLAVMLLVAGGLIAIISSTVLPEAGIFVWAAVGLMLFLLVQLVMFRLFGLRSRADELSGERIDERVGAPAGRRFTHRDVRANDPLEEAADALDAEDREAPGRADAAAAARVATRGGESEREGEFEPQHEGDDERDEESSSERSRDWRAWRG